MIAPFEIHQPEISTPLLFDSPHSGRFYPTDFESRAMRAELRRGEDAYVDELLAGAPSLGATLLSATYPRCYIDVNRAENDIDEALLSEPWPGAHPLAPTEKTRRGLGLIRRFVTPGVEAQARPLTVDEVQQRIDRVYRPYHAALESLVESIRERHGTVWHVNWHSMKSVGNAMTPDGPGGARADFVVSDVRGASASSKVTAVVVYTLQRLGYTVSVNDPYTGGAIVQRIGAPSRGVHSVQIEINRRLYLDEVTVEKTAAWVGLSANLRSLTEVLVAAAGESA